MPVQFDISKVPFSRLGSYFSFSVVDHGELGHGLYLRTHHGGAVQAFRVDPARDSRVLDFETKATPDRLIVKASGGGEIAFAISPKSTVRVLGSGVGLRLEMPQPRWRFAYELPGGVWGFNMPHAGVQLALETLRGELTVDAPWEKGKGFCNVSTRMVATLTPERDGSFEAAIDEFTTTWIKSDRPPFETCLREVAGEYACWESGLPDVGFQHVPARDLAGYVNWSATVDPSGYLARRTMLMSNMSMCNVFGWDHVFNAMAHCSHDPELAWDQFMVMADRQDEYGKCPDNMNDRSIMYTFSKPPIHGWALLRMWDENPSLFTPERLAEAYTFLSKASDWWCRYRTWPGQTLPFYIHGFDSGWDNSTIFDDGVPVVAPDLAAYLVIQLEVLAKIAQALGNDREAASWRRRSEELLAALLENLWKDDHFVGMRGPEGIVVECESLLVCLPIVLGHRLPEDVRSAVVARLRRHLTPWGLATEMPDSSQYSEKGYWRGPIWAPSTMLIVTGLFDIGEEELAKNIVQGFCKMCADNGFYENFDAMTGTGYFDPAYTWTSSVFIIFASQPTWAD